jgi:hypothetical protein
MLVDVPPPLDDLLLEFGGHFLDFGPTLLGSAFCGRREGGEE